MAYKRFRSFSKPTQRSITVKYAAPCACCGAVIPAGSVASYYPVGTIAGVTVAKIAHLGGLDGNSQVCAGVLKENHNAALNNYAGDGLDNRYEDNCREKCGL